MMATTSTLCCRLMMHDVHNSTLRFLNPQRRFPSPNLNALSPTRSHQFLRRCCNVRATTHKHGYRPLRAAPPSQKRSWSGLKSSRPEVCIRGVCFHRCVGVSAKNSALRKALISRPQSCVPPLLAQLVSPHLYSPIHKHNTQAQVYTLATANHKQTVVRTQPSSTSPSSDNVLPIMKLTVAFVAAAMA